MNISHYSVIYSGPKWSWVEHATYYSIVSVVEFVVC